MFSVDTVDCGHFFGAGEVKVEDILLTSGPFTLLSFISSF